MAILLFSLSQTQPVSHYHPQPIAAPVPHSLLMTKYAIHIMLINNLT